ncbi:hypothetical protein MMC07_008665, partial [Pseudocyphellaria aurata]|nr:hypothetical protein [Pseudocyphellaria aurata]
MENLHSSTNAVATLLFHLLVFSSLGTGAIVTKPVLPLTRKVDAAPAFITPAPIVAHQAIFARDSAAPCGYVSGNPGERRRVDFGGPILMRNDCSFSFDMSPVVYVYFGLFPESSSDYGGNLCKNLPDDQCSKIYTSILKCSSAAPYCFYYARSRSVGDMSTKLSLACGKASETVLALISTTSGHGSDAAATSAPGGISALTSNIDVIQLTDSIGATQTSDSVQPTNNPSNTGGANPSNKGSNNSSTLPASISTTGHGSDAAATSAPGGISAQTSNIDVIQSTGRIGATQTSDSAQPTNNSSNTGGANPSNKGSNLPVGQIVVIAIASVGIIAGAVTAWLKPRQVL